MRKAARAGPTTAPLETAGIGARPGKRFHVPVLAVCKVGHQQEVAQEIWVDTYPDFFFAGGRKPVGRSLGGFRV